MEINFTVKPLLPLNELALSQVAHWLAVLEGTHDENETYEPAANTEPGAGTDSVGVASSTTEAPKKRGRKASAPLTATSAPAPTPEPAPAPASVAFPAFAGVPQQQPAPEPATAVGTQPQQFAQQAPVQQFAPQQAPQQFAPQQQQFEQFAPQQAPQQFAPAPVQQFAPAPAPAQQFAQAPAPVAAPVQQFAPAPVQQQAPQAPAMPPAVQQVPQDGNGDMSLEEFREWCRQAHMRAPGMPYNLMKVTTWLDGSRRAWGVMSADGVPAPDRRRFVHELGQALSQPPAA